MNIVSARVFDPRRAYHVVARPMLQVMVDETPDQTIPSDTWQRGDTRWAVAGFGPFYQIQCIDRSIAPRDLYGFFNRDFGDGIEPVVPCEVVVSSDKYGPNGMSSPVNLAGAMWGIRLRRARTLLRKHQKAVGPPNEVWTFTLSETDAERGIISWVPKVTPRKCLYTVCTGVDPVVRAVCDKPASRTVTTDTFVEMPYCIEHYRAVGADNAARRTTTS